MDFEFAEIFGGLRQAQKSLKVTAKLEQAVEKFKELAGKVSAIAIFPANSTILLPSRPKCRICE